MLRGGEGGSIGVVWLVSSTRRRPDLISANSNTILYKMLFTIDLDYMQKLKLLADNSQSVGCMICLYTCLYGRFEALKDRTRLWVVHALMLRSNRLLIVQLRPIPMEGFILMFPR